MPCYTPHRVQTDGVNENGKVNIVWKYRSGLSNIELPCSSCIGCKLERSRNMADRCMLEADMHDVNCFVTLTFDPKHLPLNRSLDHRLFQLFMKRLRKWYGKPLKFYMCGEYGGRLGRPHYHALLFGVNFDDKLLATIRNGNKLYTSNALQKLWPYGFSSIGDVTYKSASYVTRYVLKKQSIKNHDHYVDKHTGECLKPEYTRCSNGIGKAWLNKYFSDVYPSDELVRNGRIGRPPRYFDKQLEKVNPQLLDEIKARRSLAIPPVEERTEERLAVKQRVKLAQIKSLKRELE